MADPYQAGQALGSALFGSTRGTYTQELGRQYQVEQALQEARRARSQAVLANQMNEQRALVTPELVTGVLGGDQGALGTLGSVALLANEKFDAGQLSDVLGAAARSGARTSALGGDWEAANANLMGVANGPQELGAVQGQNLLQNRFKEGGGGITTTEQGRSSMAADAARARASDASAASSYATAAKTQQDMTLGAERFAMERDGRWNPAGKTTGGAAGAGGMKLTEGQGKDVVYYTRGNEANKLLDTMDMNLSTLGGGQGKVRGLADTFVRNLPFGLGTGVGANAAVSAERQQAEQAANEFLAAVLRKDTGAAITQQEFDIYGRTYLPQPGDSTAVLNQKRRAREVALAALKAGLGPAEAAIPIIAPAGGTLGDAPAPAPRAPGQRRVFNPATGRLE